MREEEERTRRGIETIKALGKAKSRQIREEQERGKETMTQNKRKYLRIRHSQLWVKRKKPERSK